MPSLREGNDYAEDALSQARRLAEIAAYTPSPLDTQEHRRKLTEKISVDLGRSVPAKIRRLIADTLTLIHLLGGKRNYFRIPDPLSSQRLLMDEVMLARLRIVLEQLGSLLSALQIGDVWVDGVAVPHPPVDIALTPCARVIGDMVHYLVSIKKPYTDNLLGEIDVQKQVRKIRDFSPSSASLVGKLRERHRCYRDRREG